jgi:hypothetical protein
MKEIFMKNQNVSIMLLILLGMLMVNAFAQNTVPTMINYQGFLTDTTGKALDGTYMLTFRLYEQPTGVASIRWEEIHSEVTVVNGLFNVLLGSVNPLAAEHLDGHRYLEIKVEDEVEMTPRIRLASTAYALQADKMEPDYDSGWFAVTTQQHYSLDLGFELTDIPISIQVWFSNNAAPQFGTDEFWQIQAGQYYYSGASMGAYVEIENASTIKIHTGETHVIHAWTDDIDGYDARAASGFYRVLLWK